MQEHFSLVQHVEKKAIPYITVESLMNASLCIFMQLYRIIFSVMGVV